MPVNGNNAANCCVNDRNIIHVIEANRYSVWKTVHNQSEKCPSQEDDISEETVPSEPEGAMLHVVATADQETSHWNGIADVEEHYASCCNATNMLVRGLTLRRKVLTC